MGDPQRHSEDKVLYVSNFFIHFMSVIHLYAGCIPLCELVYHVFDLPPSMRPLVYDFGQLKKGTEDEYIEHIVGDHVSGI